MRESEGGTLKHTLQYLYIGNTAQRRNQRDPPIHPSFRPVARNLSRLHPAPRTFLLPDQPPLPPILLRTGLFIHLNSLHAAADYCARRVTMAPAAAAAASAAAGDAKPTSASTPPASTPTPTPTQRKVTRSRLGCETCRARKVRCDERPGKCEWKSFS